MPIDFGPDEDGNEQIPYDDAVVEGRKLVSSMKDNQFELGRIAGRVEPKYGEQTLERLAEEIGIDYGTLKSYRTADRAWQDIPVRPKSFSVAKALNRHPNRADIIQEKPDMSVKEAENVMREWKKERRAVEKGKTLRSDYGLHRNTKKVVREVNWFLSENGELMGMILEIRDHPDPDKDPRYMEEIVEALAKASLRINTLIESVYHRSKQDTVLDPSKDEVEAI